eukprot:9475555-Pyramimonas_sp.AAC.1
MLMLHNVRTVRARASGTRMAGGSSTENGLSLQTSSPTNRKINMALTRVEGDYVVKWSSLMIHDIMTYELPWTWGTYSAHPPTHYHLLASTTKPYFFNNSQNWRLAIQYIDIDAPRLLL